MPNRANFPDPQQAANVLSALQLQSQFFSGQPQFSNGQTQFANGQYSGAQRLLQEQFTLPPPTSTPAPTAPVIFPQEPAQAPSVPESITSQSYVNLNNPANVQYIDDSPQTFGSHVLFKRNGQNTGRKVIKVRRIVRASDTKKINKKRALIALSDGSFIDDKNIPDHTQAFVYDGLAQFGAGDFQENLMRQGDIEDEIKAHDREAAEDEVKAVLSLCSSCQVEPFIGAVAFTWKDAKITPDNALKGQSVGGCGAF